MLLPKRNLKDLVDVPKRVLNELRIIPVEHMDQVLEVALKHNDAKARPKRPRKARETQPKTENGRLNHPEQPVARPSGEIPPPPPAI